MDLTAPVCYALERLRLELFSVGSIFSLWSLASGFCIAFLALALRHRRRRGRFGARALLRAIVSRRLVACRSTLADAELFLISVVVMPPIVGALVVSSNAVATGVRGGLTTTFGAVAPIACCALYIKAIATLALFLAYEIGYWVDHWLKHRVPALWAFHKLHHTADALTPLVNFRNHPIDNIVFGWMLALFIGSAYGVLGWAFARDVESFTIGGRNLLFIVFLWTIGHLQHSQFWIPICGPLGRIILSPAHHQIHHSRDPAHFNRNFGSVLALWDWMAGTLAMPSRENPRLAYGVDEPGVDQHSLWGTLVAPVIEAGAAIARALRGPGRRAPAGPQE